MGIDFYEEYINTIKKSKNLEIKELKDTYLTNEKILSVIWYEKTYKKNLETIDRKKICVISPGDWNFNEGPDFINSKIKIGQKILTGDVEIHILDSDWFSHNHNKDERYKNVILHVFYLKTTDKKYLKTINNKKIYQLCLSHYIKNLPSTVDLEKYSFSGSKLAGKCSLVDKNLITLFVNFAGDSRIFIKSLDFSNSKDLKQTLYEKIAESFGYAENKDNMKTLAQKIPIKMLKEFIKKYGKNRIKPLQALLFGVSGLLPQKNNSNIDFVNELKEIWENDFKEFHNIRIDKNRWVFKNVRPLNFPHRRISAWAYFLNSIIDKNLIQLVLKNKIKLEIKKNDYFATRSNFNSKKFSPKPLFGKEKALTTVVNVILPFLLYWSKKTKNKKLQTQTFTLYHSLPALSTNRISRIMANRLFGEEKLIKDERFQQGLLQIFSDFCDFFPDCESCSLPFILRNYDVKTSQKNI